HGADLQEQMRFFVNDVIESYINAETGEGFAEDWNLERLWQALQSLYPVSVTPEEIQQASGGSSISRDTLRQEILSDAHHAYDQREETLTPEIMRQVERRVMLSVLDRKWREHLYEMDYLKEGIGLRAMAQRDPLVEYQREGYNMWQTMLESVKEEAVRLVYNAEVAVPQQPSEQVAAAPQTAESLLANLPKAGAAEAGAAEAEAEAAEAAVEPEAPAVTPVEPEVEISAPGLRTAPRQEK